MSTTDRHSDWSARDLPTKQALISVRRHPEWFFAGREFEAAELVGLLTAECLRGGVTDLAVDHLDGWIVLSSTRDWLEGDVTSLRRLQPYGSHPHSSCVEVVATAFCQATITSTRGERYAARLDPQQEIPQAVAERLDDPRKGRVLAFLPPHDEGKDVFAIDNEARSPFRLVQGGGAEVAGGVRSVAEKIRGWP